MCDELQQARELIERAPRMLILTGAGLGEESGVPACYSAGGSTGEQDVGELATPEAFARDPRRVWEWYGQWREAVARCAPSAAHQVLARFVRRHVNALLATQSVDGLHARAASADGEVSASDPARSIELHGSLFRLRCTDCGTSWEDRGPVDASSDQTLPRCPDCQAVARPDVVWFGEAIERQAMSRVLCQAELAAVCLIVGTAAAVCPAAQVAAVNTQAGGDVIEVNPCETELTSLCSVSIRDPAARALPALLDGAVDDATTAGGAMQAQGAWEET